MAVDVRIPTILRSYTGGEKSVEGAGNTLGELLADLDSRHPGLRGRLVTEEGSLHRFVNVYVNDEDVRFLQGLQTELGEGDDDDGIVTCPWGRFPSAGPDGAVSVLVPPDAVRSAGPAVVAGSPE